MGLASYRLLVVATVERHLHLKLMKMEYRYIDSVQVATVLSPPPLYDIFKSFTLRNVGSGRVCVTW